MGRTSCSCWCCGGDDDGGGVVLEMMKMMVPSFSLFDPLVGMTQYNDYNE